MSMQGNGKRGDSHDDRHILAKHMAIHPSNEEVNIHFFSMTMLKFICFQLSAIQELVTSCEKALKLVSDEIAEQ